MNSGMKFSYVTLSRDCRKAWVLALVIYMYFLLPATTSIITQRSKTTIEINGGIMSPAGEINKTEKSKLMWFFDRGNEFADANWMLIRSKVDYVLLLAYYCTLIDPLTKFIIISWCLSECEQTNFNPLSWY